ncbi:MAG: PP0621 family protein [Rhodocyclaceae bacterium]|nr:PP0621 family protein [Rhodocyclaceae bacterium]
MNLLRLLLLPFVIVGRLIFWLLFAFAAWLLVKKLRQGGAMPGSPRVPPGSVGGEKPVENMVACAHCGLLLPESDSIRRGSEHFCCEEHRREH